LSNRWASIFGKLWKWQLLKLCDWCHWQFMRVARITCEVTLSSWRWFFQNSPLVTSSREMHRCCIVQHHLTCCETTARSHSNVGSWMSSLKPAKPHLTFYPPL
jgi:hypothetical protein